MKFEQFHVGQVIELGPVRPNAEEIVAFATAFDPQWFHVDAEAAEDGPFGGLIASGWHTCVMAMRIVVDEILGDSESYASPGLDRIRWPNPVRPGDVLHLRVEVLEVRRSVKRPELGLMRWNWRMRNQDQVEVLELEATNLFNLKKTA